MEPAEEGNDGQVETGGAGQEETEPGSSSVEPDQGEMMGKWSGIGERLQRLS